jgi:hypothetical protein
VALNQIMVGRWQILAAIGQFSSQMVSFVRDTKLPRSLVNVAHVSLVNYPQDPDTGQSLGSFTKDATVQRVNIAGVLI